MEKPDKIKEKMRNLINTVNRHDYLYYVKNKPEIDDSSYDQLLLELTNLEKNYPSIRFSDSPTSRIGSDLDNQFEKVRHRIPMLSLDKLYTVSEVREWIYKNIAQLPSNRINITGEYKYDGLSVVLYYEKGELSLGVTRGDGEYGKNITENIKTIKNIPLRLKEEKNFIVRGEVILSFSDFEKINKESEDGYANPRNFAAGTLNRIKSSEVSRIPLKFIAYDGFFQELEKDFKSSLSITRFLMENGFYCGSYFWILRSSIISDSIVGIFEKKSDSVFANNTEIHIDSVENVELCINSLTELRKHSDLPVDGIVFKIDNLNARDELGFTGHHPRWAVAYKFDAPRSVSVVRSIETQVGRGGRITPVALLDPVEIAGSVVRKATLHNEDFIRSLELGIGDTVSVSKRGDIIPAVEEVLEKSEFSGNEFIFPVVCPSCSSELKKVGPIHYCQNEECPGRNLERIKYFVSRNSMNIENLGDKVVTFLFEKGFIKNCADLYTFDYGQLLKYEGFGEKKIKLIQQGLENSKNNDFVTVLSSLGLKELGKQTCQILINGGYENIDQLLGIADENDAEPLIAINGIGPKTAEIIINELKMKKNRDLIFKLKKIGLHFEQVAKQKTGDSDLLVNTKWVVTGSFEKFKPREKLKDLIIACGGQIITSVSKNIDYLVKGEDPGSKYDKAVELGIRILDESEFIDFIQDLKNGKSEVNNPQNSVGQEGINKAKKDSSKNNNGLLF